MNSEEILKWKEAGKLARNALNFGKTLIQNGASMLDVTESIEDFVIEKNGEFRKIVLGLSSMGPAWSAHPWWARAWNGHLGAPWEEDR